MNIDEIQREKKYISALFYLYQLLNIYRTSKTTFETNRNTFKCQIHNNNNNNKAAVRATVVGWDVERNAVLAGDPKVFRLLCNTNLNMIHT